MWCALVCAGVRLPLALSRSPSSSPPLPYWSHVYTDPVPSSLWGSLQPVPPADPVPPPARPPPPPCGVFPSVNGVSGCVPGGDLNFSNVFGSRMVLQMQPAKAAVYGYVGTNASKAYGSAQITITVSPAALPVSIANAAAVEAGPWPSYSVDAVSRPWA